MFWGLSASPKDALETPDMLQTLLPFIFLPLRLRNRRGVKGIFTISLDRQRLQGLVGRGGSLSSRHSHDLILPFVTMTLSDLEPFDWA